MMEWRKVKLGEIVSLVIDYRGKTPLKLGGDWVDSGYRAFSAKNIKTGKIVQEESIRFVDEELYKKWMKEEVKRGDIFITSEAPFGEVYYWDSDEKIVLSQRLFDIRLKDDVDSRYVYYYMTTNNFKGELDGRATGTTVIGLRQPELLRCEIPLPPLPTQRRIAAILSSLDAQIENNNRINHNLEAQAQALFKSWFVDFAPWGGVMPEDWREGNIFDIADILDKKRKPLSSNERDKMKKVYPYYGATSCMDYVEDYLFDGYYTLLGEDGSVIKEDGTPYVQYVWGKLWVNNHAHVLQGKNGYSTEMLHTMLSQLNITPLITGAVQAKLNQGNMQKIKVIIATDEVMQNASKTICSLYAQIRNNTEANARLASLRDTLLPKLMKGEIEVCHH